MNHRPIKIKRSQKFKHEDMKTSRMCGDKVPCILEILCIL
jgi:hypothetical protein